MKKSTQACEGGGQGMWDGYPCHMTPQNQKICLVAHSFLTIGESLPHMWEKSKEYPLL